jgi:hypothetical protein
LWHGPQLRHSSSHRRTYIPRGYRTNHNRRAPQRCQRYVWHNVSRGFTISCLLEHFSSIVELVLTIQASRTKPFKFRTVVVCQRSNWLKRISDILLPNTSFIHVLAINLPLSEGQLTDDELSLLRQLLLESTEQLRHLVVVWHLWTHFPAECGYLHLESFYLICVRMLLSGWPAHYTSRPKGLNDKLGLITRPAYIY